MHSNAPHPEIRIREIRIARYVQHEVPRFVREGAATEVSYGTTFGCAFDADSGLAAVETRISVRTKKKADESEGTIAELETLLAFELGTRGPQSLPVRLVAHMVGISYSTSRGILLGKLPLPVLEETPPPAISAEAIVAALGLDWVIEEPD